MMEKYPINSDFVESYLNYFIIQKYYDKNSRGVAVDALIYRNCVNLNHLNINISMCGERREKVEKFIESKKEDFNKVRDVTVEKCHSELRDAFYGSRIFSDDIDNVSYSEKQYVWMKLKEKEDNLEKCINKNI